MKLSPLAAVVMHNSFFVPHMCSPSVDFCTDDNSLDSRSLSARGSIADSTSTCVGARVFTLSASIAHDCVRQDLNFARVYSVICVVTHILLCHAYRCFSGGSVGQAPHHIYIHFEVYIYFFIVRFSVAGNRDAVMSSSFVQPFLLT